MLRIKEFRKELGLTQKEFAEKIGLDAHNVGDWEREKCEPSIYWLIKISETFNVSLNYLVGIEEDLFVSTPSNSLTKEEERMLTFFRSCPALVREKLIEDAEYFAKNYDKLKI